jgi:hypothetical protein
MCYFVYIICSASRHPLKLETALQCCLFYFFWFRKLFEVLWE